jgi:signal transduction histidine kinase
MLTATGDNVVQTASQVLAAGLPAYDIRVPIVVDHREVGEYHVGFDVDWFGEQATRQQNLFLRRRMLGVSGVLVIALLAATSLFYIAAHASTLRRAMSVAHLERATEIGQLAAGLAHEIRNPLHAIRLNLYAMGRMDEQGCPKLSAAERRKVLAESAREIDRVERLMHELVGFGGPNEPQAALVDLKSEIESMLDFTRQKLVRQEIKSRTNFPAGPVWVLVDPSRLRQLLLNLLRRAEQALAGSGQIDVTISQTSSRVLLRVADDGPEIPEADRERVFDPFYSTANYGSGLGLALAKRFVEEAEGSIKCEANVPRGTVVCIDLPRAAGPKKRTLQR